MFFSSCSKKANSYREGGNHRQRQVTAIHVNRLLSKKASPPPSLKTQFFFENSLFNEISKTYRMVIQFQEKVCTTHPTYPKSPDHPIISNPLPSLCVCFPGFYPFQLLCVFFQDGSRSIGFNHSHTVLPGSV